jgi:hypothetical protein
MLKNIITGFVLFQLALASFCQPQELVVPDYFGEKIEYSLKVGFFQVGKVDIAFSGDSSDCGAYVICNARSTGLVNFVKDVHYRFDACLDTTTGYASQSSRKIKEGNYHDYDEVYYDRSTRSDSTIVITEDKDTLIVPKDVYDILVAFFQFRKNFIHPSLEPGNMIRIKTFFVDEEWDLNIKYAGKETIKTQLGKAKCYKFLPETEVGRYFKTKEDLTLWVTANKNLIPVKIDAKMKVGTFSADIVSYRKPTRKLNKHK